MIIQSLTFSNIVNFIVKAMIPLFVVVQSREWISQAVSLTEVS